jgi:hypothetical protein
MTEGIVLKLQLGRHRLPVDVSQVAILDDGEKEILVSLMIPLGRHCGWGAVLDVWCWPEMEDIRSDIDDLRFGVIRKVLMLRIWETEVDEIRLEQVDLGESWLLCSFT